MATFIAINGFEGSNVTFDFDGTTPITLTAHSASPTNPGNILPDADCTWSLLDAPAGTIKNVPAFFGTNPAWPNINTIPGAVLPPGPFVPDVDGTWLFRCANSDGTSDQVVVGVRSNRSDIRIPAAGETTEADATRGWAVDRDAGLSTFDELITAGGIQVCKLAPGMAAADAGVLLSYTGIDDVNPTTGESIPRVDLASTAPLESNYIGVLKGDIDGATAGIAAESYVWVSRSGIVTGGAVGTLDLTTFTVGDIVYLHRAANAGDPFRDTDSFASAFTPFPDVMIPAGIVIDNANPGKILVAPGLKYTGAAAVNATFRYKGIGDFSSLRVGRPDGITIAGESDGTVEVIAECQFVAGIAQGQLACLTGAPAGGGLDANLADSSFDAGVSQRDGIFGIAVESVAFGLPGHFIIFGRSDPNPAVVTGPLQGEVLYVGSSTSAAGNLAGSLVRRGYIQQPGDGPSHYPTGAVSPPSHAIPVGVYDNLHGNQSVLMGTFQDDGLIHNVRSTKYFDAGEDVAWNSNILSVDNANVYHSASPTVTDGIANVNLPDTITDVLADPSTLFESSVMADALYDVANDILGGRSFVGGMDTPGAPLEKAVGTGWDPSALADDVELFGSFAIDARYKTGINPVRIEIHGYSNNVPAAGNLDVSLSLRFNACGAAIEAATTTIFHLNPSYYSTGVAGQTAVCLNYPLYEDDGSAAPLPGSPENFIGVLNQISSTDIGSIDFTIERVDTVDAGFIITKVVLVSTYSMVERISHNPAAIYEHQDMGHALYDSSTHDYLVSNQTIGTDHVVGAAMSLVIGGATGEFVGFVPLDNRITDQVDLGIEIIGQYKGAIPATSIDLELSIRFEYCGEEYLTTIGAGDFRVTDNVTPAIDTSGAPYLTSYEVLCFNFVIPTATLVLLNGGAGLSPANMPVLHYKIERTGLNPAVGETFFHVTNVRFQQDAADLADLTGREEIFENHNPSVFSINGTTGALNHTVLGDGLDDYAGFKLTAGGTELLLTSIDFDKRYNDRDAIEITVTGAILAPAGVPGNTIALRLDWASLYCSGSVPALAVYDRLLSATDDISAHLDATRVFTVCHTFYLGAYQLWEGNAPMDGSPINHNSLMLQISRTDSYAGLYTVLSVGVQSEEAKRLKEFDGYIEVSEDRLAITRSRMLVPGGFRHDFRDDLNNPRSLLLSAHRYTLVYGADGSATVAGGGTLVLQPSGISAPIATAAVGSGQPGHMIPYNLAITGVFGWFEDMGQVTPLTSCRVALSIYDVPKGVVAVNRDGEEGVYHLPLRVGIDPFDNALRWTGNLLNIDPTDTHQIPLIYLPSNYGAHGGFVRWLLSASFVNGLVHAVDPIGNIMVEVAVLPTAE
jgi:hypothetical protein